MHGAAGGDNTNPKKRGGKGIWGYKNRNRYGEGEVEYNLGSIVIGCDGEDTDRKMMEVVRLNRRKWQVHW